MDNNKPSNQENPSQSQLTLKTHDSTTKKPTSAFSVAIAGGSGGDRLKRDEWSEGAVSCLLEAYEAKWVLRNRAKLKGHDWEEVAKHVSSRANSSKSPKTQTQCKNKIESMKKRYRSESATAEASSWPLFPRLDLLLRGTGGGASVVTTTTTTAAESSGDPPYSAIPISTHVPLMVFEPAPTTQPAPPPPIIHSLSTPVTAPVLTPMNQEIGQNSIDSNGLDRENKEDVLGTKMTDNQPSEKMEVETDCSTPALYSNDKEKSQPKKRIPDNRKRRRKGENWDIGESIRWFAEVMVKSEQAKVETLRDMEKMRVDAEVKRSEMDLKRTEIIAHTQLEIARLFAASLGKVVDPSLRMGRN